MKFVNLFLSRYSSAPESQQGSFKSCLQQWYQKICTHVQKNYIRNKTAQLLCMLFIQEYPQKVKHYFKSFFQLFCKNIIFMILSSVFFLNCYTLQWNTFFNELLSLLDVGQLGIDAYLRVLVSIDEEVVVRQIPHTDMVESFIIKFFNLLYISY